MFHATVQTKELLLNLFVIFYFDNDFCRYSCCGLNEFAYLG